MSFENAILMLLLLVPFTLFAILVLTNKEGVERVFSKEVLERIKVEGSGISNRARNIIFFISILFMILAIGRPTIIKGERDITIKSLNVILALDISSSMRSKDRYPNRLEFAKKKTKELLGNLIDDEIMVLTFSNSVYLVSPMTSDKDTLKEVIDGIDNNYLLGSTNFEALGVVLKNSLKNREPKIAVVISDGGDKEDLKKFKEIIKNENIKLYAILIGTQKGAPILDEKGKTKLINDKIVMSRLNIELGKIAKESGGDYIVASYSGNDIEKLANKIDSNIARDGKKRVLKVKDRVELFYFPLILSILLLLISLSSIPTKDEFFGKSRVKRGKNV
jgi:Ca-activated chloride channel family protein